MTSSNFENAVARDANKANGDSSSDVSYLADFYSEFCCQASVVSCPQSKCGSWLLLVDCDIFFHLSS